MSRIRFSPARAALAMLLVVAGTGAALAATAGPALAVTDVTCVHVPAVGETTLIFNPDLDLTITPTHVTGSSDTFTCSDGVNGYFHNISVHADAACTVSTSASGNITIKWANNENSNAKVTNFSVEDSNVPGTVSKVVVMSGEITSGRHNGATFVGTMVSTANSAECLAGMENLEGPMQLLIDNP